MMRRFTAFIAVASVIVLWEIACRVFSIPPFLLPTPSAIVQAINEFGPHWWRHIFETLATILAGFAVALVLGVPIAVAIARSGLAYRAIYPFLVIKQSTPIIAIAPIIVVVVGAGFTAKVIVACLVAIFPIIVSTATGLMATPSEYLELARSVRQNARRELFRIRFPFAVRYIFSGLRISIALAVIGAVVAEFVSAGHGLGYVVYSSMAYLRTALAFGALAFLAIIGIVLFHMVALTQRVFFPWASEAPGHEDDAG